MATEDELEARHIYSAVCYPGTDDEMTVEGPLSIDTNRDGTRYGINYTGPKGVTERRYFRPEELTYVGPPTD